MFGEEEEEESLPSWRRKVVGGVTKKAGVWLVAATTPEAWQTKWQKKWSSGEEKTREKS